MGDCFHIGTSALKDTEDDTLALQGWHPGSRDLCPAWPNHRAVSALPTTQTANSVGALLPLRPFTPVRQMCNHMSSHHCQSLSPRFQAFINGDNTEAGSVLSLRGAAPCYLLPDHRCLKCLSISSATAKDKQKTASHIGHLSCLKTHTHTLPPVTSIYSRPLTEVTSIINHYCGPAPTWPLLLSFQPGSSITRSSKAKTFLCECAHPDQCWASWLSVTATPPTVREDADINI